MTRAAAATGQAPRSAQPAPGIVLRRCSCGQSEAAGEECAECRKKRLGLQRSATAAAAPAAAPPVVHQVLRSPGEPLAPAARAFLEPRLGHDLGAIRIHTDARAAESARAVSAVAYAVGRDLVFAAGKYAPEGAAGRRLLAHELAHALQQRGQWGDAAPAVLPIGGSRDPLERAADATADVALQGAGTAPAGAVTGVPLVQRATGPSRSSRPPPFGRGLDEPFGGPSPEPAESLGGGESLSYREATELVECIRILGEGGEPTTCTPDRPLTWGDYTGTPPAGSPFSAWTRPDIRRVSYSPPGGYCRHLVLGDPLDIRFKFQAFLDASRSWVKPSVRNASDPAQNGCNRKILDCENHFNNVPAGRVAGPFRLATPGGCPAAVTFPASAVATSLGECQSVLMPACNQREQDESNRVLRHEQVHFDIGCVLAKKANALLASGGNAENILRGARAQLQPLHDRYDADTTHGCLPGPQAAWEQDVANGLPTVTVTPIAMPQRPPTRRRRR